MPSNCSTICIICDCQIILRDQILSSSTLSPLLIWSGFLYFKVLILFALPCLICLSLSRAIETSLSVTNFLGNTVYSPSLNNIAAGDKPVAG